MSPQDVVLYLAKRRESDPWLQGLRAGLPPTVAVRLWDPSVPWADQVRDALVVVDVGSARIVESTHVFEAANAGVRLWQVYGVGIDHLPLEAFAASGLPLAHTPGQTSAAALAEHALLLMLAVLRGLTPTNMLAPSGELGQPLGHELGGRTLAIVGWGASGQELAHRAKALGLEVGVVTRHPERVSCEVAWAVSWAEKNWAFGQADIISLHVPLTPATRHFVDSAAIAAFKPGAIVINVARGGLVDEDALYHGLQTGKVGGAGLDVLEKEPIPPSHPLRHLPNVIITPHVAGATSETIARRVRVVAENISRAQIGRPFLNVISTCHYNSTQ